MGLLGLILQSKQSSVKQGQPSNCSLVFSLFQNQGLLFSVFNMIDMMIINSFLFVKTRLTSYLILFWIFSHLARKTYKDKISFDKSLDPHLLKHRKLETKYAKVDKTMVIH